MTKKTTYSAIEAIAGLCLVAVFASRIWILILVSGASRIGVPGALRISLETALILLALYGMARKMAWAGLLAAGMLLWVAVTILMPFQHLVGQSGVFNLNPQIVFATVSVLAGFALLVRYYVDRRRVGGEVK